MKMWQALISLLKTTKSPAPIMQVPPVGPEATTTVAECQQLLLSKLKSGEFMLSSSDKEGYRVLCYYRRAFLFAEVGDDGTGLLRLSNDEILLNYVWRKNGYKMVMSETGYQWSYDLTEQEKLEKWRDVLAQLKPFSEGTRQFVTKTLADFAALLTE